jgi:hypothetical protein
MRWLSALLALTGLGALGVASCRTTSAGCEAYCEAVAEALERCDLVNDESLFDRADCEERTLEVAETTCSETAIELALIQEDDCPRVVNSFCPDETLDCPDDCFGECCTDADCPPESPACEFGSCKRCTVEGAATHCGPTMGCDANECVECTAETEGSACASDEGCHFHRCRKRCFEHPDCGALSRCGGEFCTAEIGTPCPNGDPDECGIGGTCESVNAANMTVAPYCSFLCFGLGECPTGYTCVIAVSTCLQN